MEKREKQMEENNNTQENGSIFGNMNSLDDEPKKDLYEGLDSDTFGKAADAAKVQDATEDQNATVHTSDWNSDVYVPGGQTSYYNAEMPAPEKKQSKALEICALVFGILSLISFDIFQSSIIKIYYIHQVHHLLQNYLM